MRTIRVTNAANGKLVGDEIAVAESSLTRLFGLMGRRNLEPGHGLLITPSSGVHTFGMRFAIDVVGLDHEWLVVGVWPELKPYRLSGISMKYKSILELPPGRIAACGITVGDQLLQG
jgi:uncharacterized membrane protein (UPF0127 family)